ncbi:hypothetical protein DWB77_00575 [Streptomyces hundungensis]|uniref:Uncharacterized protein n=1 Tax=Streptomyces hundungensis TaxID=1077946 RepID=A0A387HCU4_9ACTN|nr:hypothetical protein [Streptomyces hundungensis]AYG78468.1 hypothetical protein DWB77_00575 [Streptomyces hundungensis]
MYDLMTLAQGNRPDGPSWFPYAFLAVAVLVGIFLVVRFLNRRR